MFKLISATTVDLRAALTARKVRSARCMYPRTTRCVDFRAARLNSAAHPSQGWAREATRCKDPPPARPPGPCGRTDTEISLRRVVTIWTPVMLCDRTPWTALPTERTIGVPKTDYDEFAEEYSTDNEVNLLNGHYERPAMLNLAGDVVGHRILDVGCGSGPLSAALRDRGAIMTGFDLSAAMIELARRRLGEDVDLGVHNLASRLPYGDAAFDDVVASLVLHYLEDWTEPLAELRRVLKPGGRLIVSVNHPFLYTALHPDGYYFDVAEFSFDAEHAGRTVVYTNWHRPLQSMTDAFAAAQFRVSAISEPPIAPDTPDELLPPQLKNRRRFISFIFFVLEAC